MRAGSRDATESMKTVLRLPNWVGDAVLALPAIAAWQSAQEQELLLAGRKLPLLLASRVCPRASRLELAGRGAGWAAMRRDAQSLRASGAQRGVLLTPSFSAALWLRWGGVRERWGWPEQGRGFLLTHRVPRPGRSDHIVEQFHRLATAPLALDQFGGHRSVDRAGDPMLPVDEDAREAAERFLVGAEQTPSDGESPLIVLCPGVRYGTAKRWPLARFAALARRLAAEGAGGLVVGSQAERSLGERICQSTATAGAGAAARWRNACGKGSLLFAAELLRRASAVVCNDTGTMHLATAVGTPVVALFGPTDPNWTRPRGKGHRLVRREFPCGPCLRRHCPYGDPAPCMAAISVTEVARAVGEICGSFPRRLPAGQRRPAIFLDRDGTLIEHEPYLHDPSRVRLTAGSAAALRRAQAAGYLLVVVTNQSGIARALFDEATVRAVHARLRQLLAEAGIALDAIYVCPHHPEFSGPCDCRKPAPGLLLRAIDELQIDAAQSLLIGDTLEDVEAGAAAGVAACLVRTGCGTQQARRRAAELPAGTRVVADLAAALAELPSGIG